MRFLLAGPLFAGKSFLLKKPSLPGQPQFAGDDFQTVRTQFAVELPMLFAAAHINLMSERHVRHHNDHRSCD